MSCHVIFSSFITNLDVTAGSDGSYCLVLYCLFSTGHLPQYPLAYQKVYGCLVLKSISLPVAHICAIQIWNMRARNRIWILGYSPCWNVIDIESRDAHLLPEIDLRQIYQDINHSIVSENYNFEISHMSRGVSFYTCDKSSALCCISAKRHIIHVVVFSLQSNS